MESMRWVDLARKLTTDDLEIDEHVRVSEAEDGSGAWVRAWVWVDSPEEEGK